MLIFEIEPFQKFNYFINLLITDILRFSKLMETFLEFYKLEIFGSF